MFKKLIKKNNSRESNNTIIFSYKSNFCNSVKKDLLTIFFGIQFITWQRREAALSSHSVQKSNFLSIFLVKKNNFFFHDALQNFLQQTVICGREFCRQEF